MKFVIEKPINGISLNGNETLMNDKNEPMLFDSEEQAKNFLYTLAEKELIDEDLDSGALLINKETV